ncbi:lysophosphatidylserine lipase ABHD12-like isoform X5 [Heptranchias perlo]|uniref:lysophosphatidylserine lipase ABHD12-like isoform X5 n=1 Tax=Heptranchias perlo TaxID=212740 RepID=UPI00355AAE65
MNAAGTAAVRMLRNHGSELKLIFLTPIVIYVTIPFAFKICPTIVTKLVYLNFLRRPFIDFKQPANYLLNHTVNLYLIPEEGITVGVWHTVPDKRWQEARGKDQQWYEAALGDDNPVIVYLHGNGGNAECTWVPRISPGLQSVATNTARSLHEKGSPADAVILESPFTSLREEVAYHPLAVYYKIFPAFEWFFMDTLTENNIIFHNVENLKSISTPVLILHAEDDNIIPFELGKKLYESLLDSQIPERQVKFVAFPALLGYKHNNIYKDPQLPEILKEFVKNMRRY